MKKLRKDFQKNLKNINNSRDAPKDNSSVDKIKSKLVHSEDYRNKIIKTGEKFKDKIAEKDSKLSNDSNINLEDKTKPNIAKRRKVMLSNKTKPTSTNTVKSKLVHSKDYRNKIIKAKNRYKDKLRSKNSKLIQDESSSKNLEYDGIKNDYKKSKSQFYNKIETDKELKNDSSNNSSSQKDAYKKSKYKRRNYENSQYTRKKINDIKKDVNKATEDKDFNFSDKRLKKQQQKQYKLKNKLAKNTKLSNFTDETLKASAKSSEMARNYLSQGRENAGIESAEKIENTSASLQHGIRKYRLNKKKKSLRKISKLENKINKRKSKLEFKSAVKDLKAKDEYLKSNAIKKFFKRRQMKKMIAKKYETTFVDKVKKRFFNLSKKAKEVVIKKVKGFLFIVIIAALLMSGMISLFSLGGTGINSSTSSVLATSYLSDETVLNGINTNFTKLEDELADKIANIENDYPDYDQYIYIDTENIGHSIYELFAYITAKCGGPEDPSEVQPDLIDLFNQMYQLEFKEKVEIKTRVVNREYIDEHGRIHTVQEQEPYEYKTLITTLKFKTIGEVAQEVFQGHEDNMLHYNTLMETRGNSGATFGNSELIEANGGVGGGQDYEASSDVQKKIVDACYITPSPGKGWCAMWVSQVYQNAGLGYIGGNACDLYKRYAFTSDPSKLEVGMLVMVESSSSGTEAGLRYGHVGIYIGDGKVIDNIGKVRVTTLDNWIKTFCKNSPVGFGYPPSVQP